MNHTCPFCGSRSLTMTEEREGIIERVMYWIRCRKCGAHGPWKTARVEAIESWDLRVEAKMVATIAEEIDA